MEPTITALTNGILLTKEPCVLVLFGMTALDIGNIHMSSMYGTYSLNKPDLDFWGWPTTPGFVETPCMIGISYLSQISQLQTVISDAADKRIVVLDDMAVPQNVSLNISYINSLKSSIDKRHHPVQIIRKRSDGNIVDNFIVCRGSAEETLVDQFKNAEWFLGLKLDGATLEKLCNNGKHILHGKQLTVSAFSIPPYIIFNSLFTKVTGVAVDLVELIASNLNFKLNYILAPIWGGYENGKIVYGSVGQMLLGQSDFVIEDPIQLCLPHYPKMTNSHIFYQSNMNFLVRRPQELPPEHNIAYVLDKATWVAFFTSWLVVTVVFGCISKMNGELFSQSIMIPYGIVFQEFHEYNPIWKNKNERHSRSSQWLRMLWIIVSTLVVSSFLGNLKSSFILKRYEDAVETLADIIDLNYAPYLEESVYIWVLDFNIAGEEGRILAERAAAADNVVISGITFMDDAFNKVVNEGGTAIFNPESALYFKGRFLTKGQDFPVVLVPERLSTNYMGYSFPYYSPMAPLFNNAIDRIIDSGIIERLFGKHSPYRSMKHQVPRISDEDNKVQMAHISIMLWFWVAGQMLAVILFTFEKCKVAFRPHYKMCSF